MKNRNKIMLLFGSFNPPTIAHGKLLTAAIQHTGAEQGFFVPCSQAYIKRKLRKTDGESFCIPAELRLAMLRAMCAEDTRLSVSELDMRSPRNRTLDTMQAIQELYPDNKLYFISGADKIDLLTYWAEKTDFLNRFGIVLFSRDSESSAQLLSERSAIFGQYAPDSVLVFPQPEDVKGISSTEARRCLKDGRTSDAEPLIHPGAWPYFRTLTMQDLPPVIERFQEKYAFLDNSYSVAFCWSGQDWLCAEAAIQYARCADEKQKHTFIGCGGEKAKAKAHKVTPRADWDELCLTVVEEILTEKFTQNPELAGKLIATGNAVLVSGGNKKDTFWGVDLYSDCGENHLGKILMKIREKLSCGQNNEQ